MADREIVDAALLGYKTYIENRTDISRLCRDMLDKLMSLSESALGFLSEYRADPVPHLRHRAMSDITWDQETRDAHANLNTEKFAFYGDQHSLYDLAMCTQQLVISNDVPNDSRRDPSSRIPLSGFGVATFAGIPLVFRDRLVGAIGLANRAAGYTPEVVRALAPLVEALTHILGDVWLVDTQIRSMEEASHARVELWGMLTHDIRSPLSEIVGASELLRATDLTSQQAEYVKIIQNCGTCLADHVAELFEYSKCAAGTISIVTETFPLEACVSECFDTINTFASKKELVLVMHIAENVPDTVSTDRRRVKRILSNILSNAVKYTDAGGVVTTQITAGRIAGGKCTLTFATHDTGVGIPADKLTTIFEPYKRACMSSQYKGTGLGLFICKEFAQLLGGTVFATSVVGVGSTVTFSIVAGCAPAPTPGRPLRHVKTILVDGNVGSRLSYVKVFLDLGVKPQSCSSGREALEYVRVYDFDVMFLVDSRASGVDCADVGNRARRLCGGIKIVVAVSAVGSYPDGGPFDVQLARPISKSSLAKALAI